MPDEERQDVAGVLARQLAQDPGSADHVAVDERVDRGDVGALTRQQPLLRHARAEVLDELPAVVDVAGLGRQQAQVRPQYVDHRATLVLLVRLLRQPQHRRPVVEELRDRLVVPIERAAARGGELDPMLIGRPRHFLVAAVVSEAPAIHLEALPTACRREDG